MKVISKIRGLSIVLTSDSEFGRLYLAAKQGLSGESQNDVMVSLANSGAMNSSNAASLVMAITGILTSSDSEKL